MTPPPFIIGFSGKMGSGKDYIAKEVIGNYLIKNGISYIQMAFGDSLKVHLMAKMDLSFESLYINKTTDTRKKLQEVGMEMRKMDDNIWIKYLDSWINVYGYRGIKVILITDVRFPIEYKYIKEKGGIIFRIIAPMRTLKKMEEETGGDIIEMEKIKNHISEVAMDDYSLEQYDVVLYNDNLTKDEIMDKVDKYIKTVMEL